MKSREELENMSKLDLDMYGEEIGLKLDRRRRAEVLVEQILEKQGNIKVEEPIESNITAEAPEVDTTPEVEEEQDPYRWMGKILGGLVFVMLILMIIFLAATPPV